MIHGHKLLMFINGGSVIWIMSDEVARELNIRWKRVDWKMFTADGNPSDLCKVAESMAVNIHGIAIPLRVVWQNSDPNRSS